MDRTKCLKHRILQRKKRKLRVLLQDLAKELLSQYTFSTLFQEDDESSNSPTKSNNSVRRSVDALRSLSVRPCPNLVFRNFLREHTTQFMDEPFLTKIIFSDYPVTFTDVPEVTSLKSDSASSIVAGNILEDNNKNNGTPILSIKDESFTKIAKVQEDCKVDTKQQATPMEQTLKLASQSSELGRKKLSPKPPKKYSEKMKAEASIIQRIQELQKEGMWYDKRLPKIKEPERTKLHRDFLVEEALWMQMDFQQERKWKQLASKRISKAIRRHFKQKQLAAERALKEDEIRKRRMCSFIAREIQKFWGNVKKVIELREQSKIEDLKKKALDQQLSFIVDQTEKYSDLLAEKFQTGLKKEGDASTNVSDLESLPTTTTNSDAEFEPNSGSDDDEETIAKADAEAKSSEINKEVKLLEKESKMDLDDFLDDLPPGYLDSRLREIETEKGVKPSTSASMKAETQEENSKAAKVVEDDEFTPPSEVESDVENTIDEQEKIEAKDGADHTQEIDELNADAEMTIEELKAKYCQSKKDVMDSDDSISTVVSDEDEESRSATEESDSEEMQSYETADLVQEDETESGLASLLKTFAPEGAADVDEDAALNSVAALAQSFQPKGYTLSSTNVVTKIPHLIKHTLREYQHIGLDWLVTMYEKKLNGILADEMGLGKTIQTIALLAHLACEKGNWGPHLIVVPTSVMLNWEMEFKKWCPGFKILTYYGSQKERKLKRTGWTKANSFHVCITSYKLVIQDHQSFRRKRWKYLILDEAQNIKNFKSQRWQLLLNFNSQRRLLLTGTPLQNNLMELWSLMHFLMPNVFQSHREFREWFSNPVSGMVEGSAEYNENIIRRLHKVLRPFILRRLKSEVEKQLPKKYEHLVMCRLSKRQRYLYEEFMSRSRTRDTLSSGNLLSVINILMQLRKVCNHPNLFEPRPVISPMQSDGIIYYVPSLVWNIVDEILLSKPSHSIFRMTVDDLYFSKEEGWRIHSLSPNSESPFLRQGCKSLYESDKIQKFYPDVPFTLTNSSKIKIFKSWELEPPIKRKKLSLIENVESSLPPTMPRLNSPIPFFVSSIDPNNGLLDDSEFVDFVSKRSQKKNNVLLNQSLFNGELELKPKVDNGGKYIAAVDYIIEPTDSETPVVPLISEDIEEEDEEYAPYDSEETEDSSEVEVVESYKKRKVSIIERKKNGTDGIYAAGINPIEFELPEIQERFIENKKAVLTKLERINHFRCDINPVYGQTVIERLEIFPSRVPDRRQRSCFNWKGWAESSAVAKGFKLGYSEVERVFRTKLRHVLPIIPNHPYLFSDSTKTLLELVPTLEERLEVLKPILSRYVIYIPSVTAPLTQCKVFKPSPSRYVREALQEKEMKEELQQSTDILYPIVSGMSTHFPEPRLIQYDCGKLQTLDRLLRQLKTGSHRVLIFTQMARMLDVLEAFLNYHGHIYLRLDGSTRIDQRQLLMERFNTDKRIFCFILSTRSGGIGVNLTGADTVIFYDSDWNPTMDAQAQDRCHRIGQTRDVHIYRLVSEKTVEENILKKSNQKRMLGEIAIEGGSFNTAFFTKNTIHDLFTVDHQENDPRKRLAELASGSLSYQDTLKVEEGGEIRPTIPIAIETDSSPEDKSAMQMLESALLTAEDDTDVQAARTVRAEAAAELAEFDENISLDDLDNTHALPATELPKSEIEEIFDQLNPVELYAIRWMGNCMEDWTSETYANAEKDLEKQKQEWEEAQQKHLQDLEKAEEENEDEESDDDEIVTYLSLDSNNQVNKPSKQIINSKKSPARVTKKVPDKRKKSTSVVRKSVKKEREVEPEAIEAPKRKPGRPRKNFGIAPPVVKAPVVKAPVVKAPVNAKNVAKKEKEVAPPTKRFIPSPNKIVTRRSAGQQAPPTSVPHSRARAKLSIKKSCVALQKRDSKNATTAQNSESFNNKGKKVRTSYK